MDYEGQDNWAHSSSGDVSIGLGAGHSYILHSWILRKHSPFFAEQLTEVNTKVPDKRAGKIRWKLELVERPAPDDTGAGVLELLVSASHTHLKVLYVLFE